MDISPKNVSRTSRQNVSASRGSSRPGTSASNYGHGKRRRNIQTVELGHRSKAGVSEAWGVSSRKRDLQLPLHTLSNTSPNQLGSPSQRRAGTKPLPTAPQAGGGGLRAVRTLQRLGSQPSTRAADDLAPAGGGLRPAGTSGLMGRPKSAPRLRGPLLVTPDRSLGLGEVRQRELDQLHRTISQELTLTQNIARAPKAFTPTMANLMKRDKNPQVARPLPHYEKPTAELALDSSSTPSTVVDHLHETESQIFKVMDAKHPHTPIPKKATQFSLLASLSKPPASVHNRLVKSCVAMRNPRPVEIICILLDLNQQVVATVGPYFTPPEVPGITLDHSGWVNKTEVNASLTLKLVQINLSQLEEDVFAVAFCVKGDAGDKQPPAAQITFQEAKELDQSSKRSTKVVAPSDDNMSWLSDLDLEDTHQRGPAMDFIWQTEYFELGRETNMSMIGAIYRHPSKNGGWLTKGGFQTVIKGPSPYDCIPDAVDILHRRGIVPYATIHIEHCCNCEKHRMSTRHKPGSYEQCAAEIISYIEPRLPSAIYLRNHTSRAKAKPHFVPRTGAFEITLRKYGDDATYVMFSKLVAGNFPTPDRILSSLSVRLVPPKVQYPSEVALRCQLVSEACRKPLENSLVQLYQISVHQLHIPGKKKEEGPESAKNSSYGGFHSSMDLQGIDEILEESDEDEEEKSKKNFSLGFNNDLEERSQQIVVEADLSKYLAFTDVRPELSATMLWGRKDVVKFFKAQGCNDDLIGRLLRQNISNGPALLAVTDPLLQKCGVKHLVARRHLMNAIDSLRVQRSRSVPSQTRKKKKGNKSIPSRNARSLHGDPAQDDGLQTCYYVDGVRPSHQPCNIRLLQSEYTDGSGCCRFLVSGSGVYLIRSTPRGILPTASRPICLGRDTQDVHVRVVTMPRYYECHIVLGTKSNTGHGEDFHDDVTHATGKHSRDKSIASKTTKHTAKTTDSFETMNSVNVTGQVFAMKCTDTGQSFYATMSEEHMAEFWLPSGKYQVNGDRKAVRVQSKDRGVQSIRLKAGPASKRCAVFQSRSAGIIQHWYKNILKERKRVLDEAAVHIQKIVRGFISRARLFAMWWGAIKIQSIVRMMIQLVRFYVLKRGIVSLQAMWRGVAVRDELYIYFIAAVMIQKNFRGHRVRIKVAEVKLEQKKKTASLRIQTSLQGWQEKKKFKRMKFAAILIQSTWRAYVTRRDLLEQKRATLILQSRARRRQHQRRYENMRASAKKLESTWRGHDRRKKFLKQKYAAIKIAAWWKKVVIRSRFLYVSWALVVVQSFCRTALAVLHLRKVKRLIIQTQRLWRRYCARREWKKRRLALTKIQSIIRMIAQRQRFVRYRTACLIMRKNFRHFMMRMQEKKQTEAATKIQTCYRRWVCRKQYLAELRRITAIQNAFRIRIASRLLMKRKKALETLQKDFRYWIRRRERASTTIQKYWRSYYVRKKYLEMIAAALKIQTYQRKRVAFSTAQGRLHAVQALQGFIKVHLRRRKRKKSAVALQAQARGYQIRRDLFQKTQAVTRISRVFRQNLKRRMVLEESSIQIQKVCRGHRARLMQLHQTEQAKIIQKRWRIHRNVMSFQHLKATLIQTTYRRHEKEKSYNDTKKAGKVIQKVGKSYLNAKKRKNHSAVTIQSNYRRHQAQTELYERKKANIVIQKAGKEYLNTKKRKVASATTIQSNYRRHQAQTAMHARKKAQEVIVQAGKGYLRAKRKRDHSAAKIQAQFRRHQCQTAFQEQKKACIVIQQAGKNFVISKQETSAALKIQSQIRGRRARLIFDRQMEALHLIQTLIKSYLMLKRLKHNSATRIQAKIRARQAQAKYQKQRQGIIRLQGQYRTKKEQKRYRQQKQGALKIQRTYKGFRDNKIKIESAKKIQAKYRGHQQRREFDNKKKSAVKIQKAFKGFSQEKAKRQKYATVIQTSFRRHKHQKDFVSKKKSAVKIQKNIRKHLKHKAVKRNSAITIQKHARRRNSQRSYVRKRKSAQRIQHSYRVQRALKAGRNMCAIVIQKMFRGYSARWRFQLRKRLVTLLEILYIEYSHRKIIQYGSACCIQTMWRRHKHYSRLRQLQAVFHVVFRVSLFQNFALADVEGSEYYFVFGHRKKGKKKGKPLAIHRTGTITPGAKNEASLHSTTGQTFSFERVKRTDWLEINLWWRQKISSRSQSEAKPGQLNKDVQKFVKVHTGKLNFADFPARGGFAHIDLVSCVTEDASQTNDREQKQNQIVGSLVDDEEVGNFAQRGLTQLTGLGYARKDCLAALSMFSKDMEKARTWLAENKVAKNHRSSLRRLSLTTISLDSREQVELRKVDHLLQLGFQEKMICYALMKTDYDMSRTMSWLSSYTKRKAADGDSPPKRTNIQEFPPADKEWLETLKDKINQLMKLGYDRRIATYALFFSQGNVTRSTKWLNDHYAQRQSKVVPPGNESQNEDGVAESKQGTDDLIPGNAMPVETSPADLKDASDSEDQAFERVDVTQMKWQKKCDLFFDLCPLQMMPREPLDYFYDSETLLDGPGFRCLSVLPVTSGVEALATWNYLVFVLTEACNLSAFAKEKNKSTSIVTWKEIQSVRLPNQCCSLAVHNGQLAAGLSDGTLVIYSAEDLGSAPLFQEKIHRTKIISLIAVDPLIESTEACDRKWGPVFISSAINDRIFATSLDFPVKHQVLIPEQKQIGGLYFDFKRKELYVGFAEGSVSSYSLILDPSQPIKYTKKGKCIETKKNVSYEAKKSFNGIKSGITALACFKGQCREQLLYAGTEKGDVLVLQIPDLNYIGTLSQGHSGAISFIVVDSAGRFSITGSQQDGTVRIWNNFGRLCEHSIPSVYPLHATVMGGSLLIGASQSEYLTVWGVGPGGAGWPLQTIKAKEDIIRSLGNSGIATMLNLQDENFEPSSSADTCKKSVSELQGTQVSANAQDSWVECWDENSNSFYFVNEATGESSWIRPKKYRKFDRSTVSNPATDQQPASRPTNRHRSWVSYIDEESGHKYWYNSDTGETKWDQPENIPSL